MARVILIRHCESSGQAPDAPLTEAGARAAHLLADRLAALAPDAVYSSPYRRARSTIEPFAARAGLPIVEDARLRERILSTAPLDDWLEHIRRSYEHVDHRAGPGGETLREIEARGCAALADIASAGHGLAIAVSHGNLISAILRAADPSFGFEDWRALRNPDLFEITIAAGRPVAFARIA
jgi:2,3-bisphosphoglycerate-dependent phosphoglycerate mutase